MKTSILSRAADSGSPMLRTAIACLGACLLVPAASAWTSSDATTLFNSYNNAFYVGNNGNAYYRNDTDGGRAWFWTQANMIEMAEDSYDRTGNTGTRDMVTALCNGFSQYHGTDWSWNEYNDDVIWACIAFSRAYLITGNTAFRDRAKSNFDMVWNRAWSTSLGGGLFWTTANSSKNACVNGPAIIAACYLYGMTGNSSYLTKAQQIYSWQRNTLFNQTTGAVADSISSGGSVNWSWLFSYNSGTFIGAGNDLYNLTGNRQYFEDALLATEFVRDSICNSAGRFPNSAGSGDGAGFNGIGIRWIARFVREQKLWGAFYPWLKYNADLAWNVRRGDNLSWSSWGTQTPAGKRYAFECFPSVTALQVIPPNNPATCFMLVNQNSGKSVDLIDGDTANGAPIRQSNYNYSSQSQSWSLAPTEDGNHFTIANAVSGKVLCVVGNSTAAGAEMHSWTYNRHAGQKWDLVYVGEGWYKIQNVGSGLILDVKNASTAAGATFQQWTDNGTVAQRFRLHPVGDYFIRALHGKYLTAQGSGSTQQVVQRTKQNDSSFKWHFYSNSGGWERVSNLAKPDWAIAVQSGSQAAGAKVDYREYNPDYQAQKIRFLPLTNGKFKFFFKHSGLVWDIPGGSSADNLQMEQHSSNGYHRQQFELERTY